MSALQTSFNKKGEIAIAIWALWFSCNKYVYENKMQSAEEIVTFISSFSMEYRGCVLNLKHPKPRSMVKWMPPPQGSHNGVGVQGSSPDSFGINCRSNSSFSWALVCSRVGIYKDLLWVEDTPLQVVEVVDADRRYSQPP
ncbi:hypothetical protein PVK06_035994 [Gossypium arboreum]|uniref:Uncharacterized protein n=1 Tax=Gossypium arboreum TaxID=29729 RepID=A0ABR0NI95_GOSAR|nr:hypothetical protein PVK06_035994 [Gossypium arboreum]